MDQALTFIDYSSQVGHAPVGRTLPSSAPVQVSSHMLEAPLARLVRLATGAVRAPHPLLATLDTTRLPALWSARYALPATIALRLTRRHRSQALATTVRAGRPTRKRCRLDTALRP